MKCSEIMEILEELAPKELACEWDNPGLLAGRGDKEVKTILVAVDATDAVLDQAEEAGADMLLTHHPLIFKPVKSVTDRDFIGRRLLRLIQADCPYYAMHTNFDAAPGCMAALAGELDSPDLPEGWVWAGRTDLRDTYAVPNAFQSFSRLVMDRLGHF